MLKSIGFALAVVLVFSCFPAGAYDVILKNGKVLKGTLISETDEMIVFKDQQGLQFSLKKSSMDLDKMKEANVAPPQPEPAPAPEPAAPVASDTKKPAKVYTASDVEKLRKKYSNLANGTTGESIDVSTPAGYYKGLMEAVTSINATMNDIDSMLNAMNTSVEVAASTGRDPKAAFRQYKSSKAFEGLDKSINSSLSELQAMNDSMQSPPANYASGAQSLGKAVESMYGYYNAVERYDGKTQIGDFRMSLKQYTDPVENAVAQIQSLPAPEGEQPPANPDQEQSQDQQQ